MSGVSAPIQRRNEWWTNQPDGNWLKWDESIQQWRSSPVPPPPPEAPFDRRQESPKSAQVRPAAKKSFRLEGGSHRQNGWTLVVTGALGGLFLFLPLFILAPAGGVFGVLAQRNGEPGAREVIMGSGLFTAIGLLQLVNALVG